MKTHDGLIPLTRTLSGMVNKTRKGFFYSEQGGIAVYFYRLGDSPDFLHR